ncbi:MAG TPA: exopolysaccharide biosynthesis protein [Allosphingosinicella sp.]|jgi:exopolysaccharide/PEP-CTERM locus tyrosine autokinase
MPQNALRPSLLERAAEIYDFSSGALIAPVPVPEREATAPVAPAQPVVRAPEPGAEPALALEAVVVEAPAQPAPAAKPLRAIRRAAPSRTAEVDRQRMREAGLLLPEGGGSGPLAEELRLVKRHLLQAAASRKGGSEAQRRSVLVASAQPDEGKTFCALNLALSLAGEQDVEVLLVDGDFPKPEILTLLGIEDGPGLIDALADPCADAESFIVRTDIDRLSVLPAGRQANNVPELLASGRTREVLAALAAADPRRIILFDSPPVLMASSAGVLASHVGQVLLVVRADRTVEADLKEAVGLLSASNDIALVLNGAGFAASGRRFGQYEGIEP